VKERRQINRKEKELRKKNRESEGGKKTGSQILR
jgi:hypothetical protein